MHFHLCPNCVMLVIVSLQTLPSWILVNILWPIFRNATPKGKDHPWKKAVPGFRQWWIGSTRITKLFSTYAWFVLIVTIAAFL